MPRHQRGRVEHWDSRCHPGFHITSNCTRCQFRKLSEPLILRASLALVSPPFSLERRRKKGERKRGIILFPLKRFLSGTTKSTGSISSGAKGRDLNYHSGQKLECPHLPKPDCRKKIHPSHPTSSIHSLRPQSKIGNRKSKICFCRLAYR